MFNLSNQWRVISRDIALLQITSNHGNSGGAIVKMAANPQNDVVVGIMDQMYNPITHETDSLIKEIQKRPRNGVSIEDIDVIAALQDISEAFLLTPIGINVCISISYAQKYLGYRAE